jgi:hypothetical protein
VQDLVEMMGFGVLVKLEAVKMGGTRKENTDPRVWRYGELQEPLPWGPLCKSC